MWRRDSCARYMDAATDSRRLGPKVWEGLRSDASSYEIQNLVGPTERRTIDSPAGPQRSRVSRMRRTPAHGGVGWPAAKQDQRKRCGRSCRRQSRASDSPSPGKCRVEPHAGRTPVHGKYRPVRSEAGERRRQQPNGPARRRITWEGTFWDNSEDGKRLRRDYCWWEYICRLVHRGNYGWGIAKAVPGYPRSGFGLANALRICGRRKNS